MSPSLQKIDEPLAITAGFDANQRGHRQSPVKSLRLTVAIDQLVLGHFSRFGINNCNLLPAGMEITSYNDHEGFSRPSSSWSSTKEHTGVGGSLRPYPISFRTAKKSCCPIGAVPHRAFLSAGIHRHHAPSRRRLTVTTISPACLVTRFVTDLLANSRTFEESFDRHLKLLRNGQRLLLKQLKAGFQFTVRVSVAEWEREPAVAITVTQRHHHKWIIGSI
jgi:hypothetical protein